MIFEARERPLQDVRAERKVCQRAEEAILIFVLLVVDALAIASGFVVAYLLRFHSGLPFRYVDPASLLHFYRNLVFWLIPVWLGMFALFRLYDRRVLLGGTQEYVKVVNASSFGMMLVVFASFLEPGFVIARGWLLLAWAFVTVFVGFTRFFIRRTVYSLRLRGYFTRRAVIVGADAEAQAIAEQLASAPNAGLRVIGFLDDARPVDEEVTPGLRVLGSTDLLESLLRDGEVCEIILVSTAISRERLLGIFQAFGTSKEVELRLSSGLFEIMTTGVQVREVGHVPLLSINRVRLTAIDALLKGVLDYSVALVGLVVLSPILLPIAVLIKTSSPGAVFYRRRVVGLGGREFDAFKFRTMVQDADAVLNGDPELRRRLDEGNHKLKDDPRITPVGRFLRRTSMDELPQLLNVLRGEMSLVGPRMITVEEQQRYGKWRTNLLTVKPGITGLWQVSGRADLSYDERVRLDMRYIRNYSIWLDLHLLVETIPAVLRGVGAY